MSGSVTEISTVKPGPEESVYIGLGGHLQSTMGNPGIQAQIYLPIASTGGPPFAPNCGILNTIYPEAQHGPIAPAAYIISDGRNEHSVRNTRLSVRGTVQGYGLDAFCLSLMIVKTRQPYDPIPPYGACRLDRLVFAHNDSFTFGNGFGDIPFQNPDSYPYAEVLSHIAVEVPSGRTVIPGHQSTYAHNSIQDDSYIRGTGLYGPETWTTHLVMADPSNSVYFTNNPLYLGNPGVFTAPITTDNTVDHGGVSGTGTTSVDIQYLNSEVIVPFEIELDLDFETLYGETPEFIKHGALMIYCISDDTNAATVLFDWQVNYIK